MSKKTRLNNLASKLVPLRTWIQSAFLLVWLDPLELRLHNICGPVFHCYSCPLATFACPIGILANFSALHLFPFIAIGVLIIAGVFFGTLICGWACPFGFLQDLVAKIPTPKFNLPNWSGYFRYAVLIIAVLAVPFLFGENHWFFICRVCPAGALEGAVPNMASSAIAGKPVIWPSALKIIILVSVIAAMFFARRPWCRILCPLGAILSLFNRVSVFFLRFSPHKCNNCLYCHKSCDYGINPEMSPNDIRCIRCLECSSCVPQAITFTSIFEQQKKS